MSVVKFPLLYFKQKGWANWYHGLIVEEGRHSATIKVYQLFKDYETIDLWELSKFFPSDMYYEWADIKYTRYQNTFSIIDATEFIVNLDILDEQRQHLI